MLAQRFYVPYIASGDLFRHHRAQGTELGLLAKGYMERGELVPDEVTIQMILEAGADPNLTTDDGRTALMIASSAGHLSIVQMLLEAGADPNLKVSSKSPLSMGVEGDTSIFTPSLVIREKNAA